MRTWSTTEEYDKQFQKIMIIGLVNNVAIRSEVEFEVAEAARETKLIASKGINTFPPELGKPFDDIERVKERLRERNYDGVITVSLIDVKAERYVNSQTTYEPLVFYDRFSNYYYRTYDLVYRPGYITVDSKYFIETNFYELRGGKLVWSGRSGIFSPVDMTAFLKRYSKGLFRELALENIIVQ